MLPCGGWTGVLGAASVLLQQMQQEPNGPKSTAAIRLALDEDRQAELRARTRGDFMQLFLGGASETDITSLQRALAADGTQRAQDIMRELTESRRIYRLNAVGSPESDSERASLLKRHFLGDYRALQERTPAPRILLKFGDNHMWKGFNDLHQLDLGEQAWTKSSLSSNVDSADENDQGHAFILAGARYQGEVKALIRTIDDPLPIPDLG